MRRARKLARRAEAWVGRRLRRDREAHGLVLMYHRVATATVDPWGLCVSPAHFDAQMGVLRESCDVVPLAQLRGQLRVGRRSRPVAAVTFDDGYRDNLVVARPILERHGIAATVFVITGYSGRDGAFWWDRLAEATLGQRPLPARLALSVDHRSFDHEDPALMRTGAAGNRARRRLHDGLWAWLVDLPDPARAETVAAIEQWAGVTSRSDALREPLSPDELGELARGGLIDLGAHTVSHPRLSQLTRTAKASEIRGSHEDLRRFVGRAPRCFSYPNGDYDAESAALVREAGFELACNSRADLVWASSDGHELSRIAVRDEPGERFRRRLGWDVLA